MIYDGLLTGQTTLKGKMHCKLRSMKFIQNYHNEHTKIEFGMLIVVILYEFHTSHFAVCAYEERVREVERGSFTPLVFSSSGGMGKAATVMYCRLANLLSERWNSPYSLIMGWLRCSLGFSLLRSSLMCLRGSRSSSGSPGVPAAVDLVAEGHLATSSD